MEFFFIDIEKEEELQREEAKSLANNNFFLPMASNTGSSSVVKNTNSKMTTTSHHQFEPLLPSPHLHLHHHHQQNQLQNHQQIQNHQISFGMMPSSSSSSIPGNYLSKDSSGTYDLGELDQAFFMYLDGQADPVTIQDQRPENSASGMRPPTLNIFPSQPMHVEPPPPNSMAYISMELPSPQNNGSKRPSEPSMELTNPRNDAVSAPEPPKAVKQESNHKRPASSPEQEGRPKTPDPKTLRRLAQNREAARKSRLRKKAYVQQLESSRIKLNQLEQELQRVRAQGMFVGGSALMGGEQGLPVAMSTISSEASMFDVEYGRWLEEHHMLVCELRAAVQEHLQDNELRMFVENCLAHYDQMVNLKSILAKNDAFHLIFGMWKTPAERCFMWIGGFRPSQLIKIVMGQIKPLSEQQIMGICGLQQSTQDTEHSLSQGLEALNQSLSDTIVSDSLISQPNMTNYMAQMAVAMNKLSSVEGFVKQADHLRYQTLHRLHQLLTIRQSARFLLAIAEYFHRLRALSSLWISRPRQE